MNSPYSCAASVLFGAITMVGFCTACTTIRDGEGLAGAGHAEQRLVRQPGLEAVDQLADRLRLVAGGLVVGDELERGDIVIHQTIISRSP